MKKNYYITTAIAYASDTPHIGNVYEVILADAIARFKRLDGYDVLFQTGTDEHGLKIEKAAKKRNIKSQIYVDQVSRNIKSIYDSVNISYDNFVRTSNSNHKKIVQDIFKKLYEKGDIYLGKYSGWYSVSEESFVLEKDIIDGKGPRGDKLEWMEEEVYFFKMSKYREKLVSHIEKNPEFIQPEKRKNEMIQNFLKEDLHDLSISRTSFEWGVPVEFDKKHIIYVWIDALSNYITGLEYNTKKSSLMMQKYWPADLHLIGKDILRFHTIYWPIILMALDLPLPKKIFGHPWVLIDKGKMSKSKGNVMYTKDLLKYFSLDTIRYYVLHEIPFSEDGNMTYELIIERNNSDLSNTLGNLLNRTIGMIKKYRDGKLHKPLNMRSFEFDLPKFALEVLPKMRKLMEEIKVSDSLELIMILARKANKYIEFTEPWKLYKKNMNNELDTVLYNLTETIRFIGVLIQPFLPDTASKIFNQLGDCPTSFESLSKFGAIDERTISKSFVLFERYDPEKKLEEILK